MQSCLFPLRCILGPLYSSRFRSFGQGEGHYMQRFIEVSVFQFYILYLFSISGEEIKVVARN